jgi:NAD(P)-dependent dehydrogenase (short-subunit alcohol dehydrogenase family)
MTDMKVAVVTGAAQGIGKRTAEVLAAKGFNLVLGDLRQPDQTISNLGSIESLVVLGDVSSETVVQDMLEQTLARFGRADVLVNNAGISFIKPAEDITLLEWQQVINVNLTAPFLLCREFGKHMLARGSGSIINIASVAGLLGVSDRSAYNASKHGLIGLTKTLAGEWGGRGVRVNAVCPGWVLTEMDHKDTGVGTYSHADIEGRVPMGRYASPEDIAQAVAFLADSTQSGFITTSPLMAVGRAMEVGKVCGLKSAESETRVFVPQTAS